MSDPSFDDVATEAKNIERQARAYERDYWNLSTVQERKNIIKGRLDFKAVSTETANAYQQDYKAKYNQFIGNKFDALPASVQQVITEALIDRGELPNPTISEGIGQQFISESGDAFMECDRCEEVFVSLEDFDIHKLADHGDDKDSYDQAEETLIAQMMPDINREKIKEARRLLAETDEGDLHRNYIYNGNYLPKAVPTLPDDSKGTVGYNDNPNAGLYDNKLFKHAPSQSRHDHNLGAESAIATEFKLDPATTESIICVICGQDYDHHDNPNVPFGGHYGDAPPTDHYFLGGDVEHGLDEFGESIQALKGVDIGYESYEGFPTKAEEAWKPKETALEGYDTKATNESIAEEVDELITTRKLNGYGEEAIKRELEIKYDATAQEAYDRIRSVEVSSDDKASMTFFGKLLKYCSEAEIQELKLYSGDNE